ncbi:hypothetical protein [Burkholderia thailandensis]|uniref:hypothetical protein n=1 Tax=Burkholderia thailandensis TaxID=57975 RepID=UPI0009B6B1D3|nr:hypothetical protein [Burkholderia thailandensis]AVR29450.1 hypothetical protein A8H32_21385 [Burkholderia thailandensis]MDD1480589.1 hypothetical protein [Burkholderia thailandensis]MDD1486328.1 hypothetical protein [Burkholderia thailandensis]MDD1492104.1 hypothetical protein [Burkholderia thailandensis]PJO73766.1 hypothetical protein CWD92_02520 [Burkholderia thailandensis]
MRETLFRTSENAHRARQIDACDDALQSEQHDTRMHASLMKTPDCADGSAHGTLCATVSRASPSAGRCDPRQSFRDAACVPRQSI